MNQCFCEQKHKGNRGLSSKLAVGTGFVFGSYFLLILIFLSHLYAVRKLMFKLFRLLLKFKSYSKLGEYIFLAKRKCYYFKK